MLKITGKLVTIVSEKTKNDKIYKRLQLLTAGGDTTLRLENVKDFQNRDHTKNVGRDVEYSVYAFPWVGKQGVPSIDYVMMK